MSIWSTLQDFDIKWNDTNKPRNNDPDSGTNCRKESLVSQPYKRRKVGTQEVYPDGNYPRYYQYRNLGQPDTVDPRIDLLKDSWFYQKRCLDIGCNAALFTLDMVQSFEIDHMEAIDIDASLIMKAHDNLAERASQSDTLAGKVSFTVGDYTQTNPYQCKSFDVVSCMSVIKWMHINNGDDVIRKVFKQIYDSLNDGGIFILEAQPWKSYKRKYFTSENAKLNWNKLEIKPEDFPEILLDIGFQLLHNLNPPSRSIGGFTMRTISVWKKG
eukprot:TRINITY_DN10738_c0_g1_i1.p1 TRINITY_DN10738_c0_g1~~TRINITY_DN10738_c0_g1_i1.p1  ORF type:complete len:270 (-),score=49.22 TRINITY_DN10738_c0_g1_i1:115-924(-)